MSVMYNKIENGLGECVKETTTRPNSGKRQKVTNESSFNTVRKSRTKRWALAGPKQKAHTAKSATNVYKKSRYDKCTAFIQSRKLYKVQKMNEKQTNVTQQQTTTTKFQAPDLGQAHTYIMWSGSTC